MIASYEAFDKKSLDGLINDSKQRTFWFSLTAINKGRIDTHDCIFQRNIPNAIYQRKVFQMNTCFLVAKYIWLEHVWKRRGKDAYLPRWRSGTKVNSHMPTCTGMKQTDRRGCVRTETFGVSTPKPCWQPSIIVSPTAHHK